MKIRQLLEARRNSEHPAQKKLSGVDPLRKYVDSGEYQNLYISYTLIDKVGINPQSPYETPIGIYAYPFKFIWNDLDSSDNMGNVPFAGNKPHLMIINPVDNILVLNDYDNLNNDIAKMDEYIQRALPNYKPAEIINNAIADARKCTNQNASRMWNITRIVANMTAKGNAAVQWNYILRKILGYSIIQDNGMGLIHPSEKTQAVFLAKSTLEVIDKIKNTSNKHHDSSSLQTIRSIIETSDAVAAFEWLSFSYANDTKLPYKSDLLKIISKDAITAYRWASATWKRFPQGEAAIAKDAYRAVRYARTFLNGPFVEAEDSIAKDSEYTAEYVRLYPERIDAMKQLTQKHGTRVDI